MKSRIVNGQRFHGLAELETRGTFVTPRAV